MISLQKNFDVPHFDRYSDSAWIDKKNQSKLYINDQ